MAVVLRAGVMLVVLVGLPSAWVYYGPLPAGAQSLVDRVVEISKTALAGETATPLRDAALVAPRYWVAADPVRDDPARATSPTADAGVQSPKNSDLREQLEPHLSILRKLGASEYTLEDWGQNGQLVRFRCAVSMGTGADFTRQFQVVAADSLTAVRQVVGEVSSWQNARGGGTLWR